MNLFLSISSIAFPLFLSYDEKSKSYYYYNNLTGRTQWEHPLDDVYRGLVTKARTESQSLSIGEPTEDATYIRDDLPSYEETPIIQASLLPKTLEPLSLGARKKDNKLSPLKAKPVINFFDKSSTNRPKLSKQKSEEQFKTGFSKRLNIFSSFDDKTPEQQPAKELTLTGGGAMFLKSNTKKFDTSPTKNIDNHPRSILRERNLLETSKSMEFDKSIEKSDREDDDKKSVRFNLDNTTDIAITLSDKSSSEEEFKEAKSRFTVSPVNELELKNSEENIKKLIKPNPTDFIKPKLKVSANSDSEEESMEVQRSDGDSSVFIKKMYSNKENQVKVKAEKQFEKAKQAIWDEKNEELQNFKDDMQESHKQELERMLIEEKTNHEEKIKMELENLRIEMENRATGTLRQEREILENKLEQEMVKLEEEYEKKRGDLEKELAEKFELEKSKLEENYKEKLMKREKELTANFEHTHKDLIASQNSVLEQLKENHSIIMEELKKEFMAEVRNTFFTFLFP